MTPFNIGTMISQENQIKQIPLDMLVPYHNHQFTLYEGERRDDMIESIKQNGIMTPIVCRPHPDEDKIGMYEILIGHNRWNCSKFAGLEFIPGIIKENLTDEEAQTYVEESNLLQRGFNDLKISEQARVIARRYNDMFSQGKRNDILTEIKILNGDTSAPAGQKSGTSRDKVGTEYGLSKNTVARLVRISKLTDNLLYWIDTKQLSVRAGVELSYLDTQSQDLLFRLDADNNSKDMLLKISEAQAKKLRSTYEECKSNNESLSRNMIMKIFAKDNKPTSKKISINPEIYSIYFKTCSDSEITEIIELALQRYFEDMKKEGE